MIIGFKFHSGSPETVLKKNSDYFKRTREKIEVSEYNMDYFTSDFGLHTITRAAIDIVSNS